MKRIAAIWLGGTILLLLTVTLAGAQTLGDYAREARKEKAQKAPAAKHFDNDNLPKTEHLSVVGQAEAKPADTSSTDSEAKPDESAQSADAKQPKPKKGDAASDKDDAAQEWKKQITDQKDQIDLLSRELRCRNLSLPVLASTLDDVLGTGFFESAFVELPGGERRKVLDQLQEDDES